LINSIEQKSIIEGNRKTYSQKIERFSSTIILPEEQDTLLTYCTTFEKQLDDFTKNTLKNYKILIEFFTNEITTIINNLKTIDELIKQTRTTITQSALTAGKTLQKKLTHLQTQLQKRQTLQKEIKQAKNQLHDQTNKVQKKEQQLRIIEQEKEYQHHTQLVMKQQLRTQELEEHKKQLSGDLSSITTALKKYERLTKDPKRIRHYLENPCEALKADTALAIVPLLNHLRETIINGTLELKQGKKEKNLNTTKTFTNAYFTKYLAQEETLKQELQALSTQLDQTSIAQTIAEQRKTVEQAKKEDTTLLQTIREKMDQVESINIPAGTKQLENDLQVHFNETIIIRNNSMSI